ncbi:MAG: Uma2 family endonuclease [Planctomycetota bacterium]|nr:Uma2 family endonuclease [Planctomycetota bacterium]
MSVMTATIVEAKEFEPGTTGWTVDDLNDPEIERQWFTGRHEIVEGVLTTMPPAHYDGSLPLGRLTFRIGLYLHERGLPGDFLSEADFVLARQRVARVDAVFVTPEDGRRQQEANAERGRGRRTLKYGRLLVPPTLIIESISLGHEAHDEETKLQWYEQFGVPNYWMLNGFTKTLRCLVRDGGKYRVDQEGRETDELRPSLFPGLIVPLKELWA